VSFVYYADSCKFYSTVAVYILRQAKSQCFPSSNSGEPMISCKFFQNSVLHMSHFIIVSSCSGRGTSGNGEKNDMSKAPITLIYLKTLLFDLISVSFTCQFNEKCCINCKSKNSFQWCTKYTNNKCLCLSN